MKIQRKRNISLLLSLLLLCGCAKPAAPVPSAPEVTVPVTLAETIDAAAELEAATEPPPPPTAMVPEAEASGVQEVRCEKAVVDYSHTEEGYVMVLFSAETDKRLKVLLKGPSTTYNYNLPQGVWTVFPLSDGDGSYQLGVYENASGKKYATVMTAAFDVTLRDEFSPFLRPNQYVNYTAATKAVEKGLELTAGLEAPLDKVGAIYDYVVGTLRYDYDKAETVKSGYLPVLDDILEEKKGICFDYAALMTAMLRSQQIPCKLVVGYAGRTYHAWISVWTEEHGWIDGAIFFDGQVWKRMDPTFASSGAGDPEIQDFIENGTYTAKYLY
nr:transglutaminase domain-containing protein [Oscillospiraceae bacterium]